MRGSARPVLAIALLLVAAAFLARELAAEAALIMTPRTVAIAPAEARPADAPAEPSAPDRFVMPPPERFAATVERPLFETSRRPVTAPEPAAAAAAPPEPLRARLRGIVVRGDGHRIAFVSDSQGGPARQLAQGDRYGEWTVDGIDHDSIVMSRDSESIQLRLGFESAR